MPDKTLKSLPSSYATIYPPLRTLFLYATSIIVKSPSENAQLPFRNVLAEFFPLRRLCDQATNLVNSANLHKPYVAFNLVCTFSASEVKKALKLGINCL